MISLVVAALGLVYVMSLVLQDRGRAAIGPGLSTAALFLFAGGQLLSRNKRRHQRLLMTPHQMPPTRLQRSLYQHRTAVRVMAVLGMLTAVGLAVARLLNGDGAPSALGSLASGGGFAVLLLSAHSVQQLVERWDAAQVNRD